MNSFIYHFIFREKESHIKRSCPQSKSFTVFINIFILMEFSYRVYMMFNLWKLIYYMSPNVSDHPSMILHRPELPKP